MIRSLLNSTEYFAAELTTALASRIDGDTWQEAARQLLVAAAQHITGSHLSEKYLRKWICD